MVEAVEAGSADAGPGRAGQVSRRAVSSGGMAATAFPAASEAAVEMLRAGGNAVDAAAAAAWALAVCEPSGSGLGGQTTLLVRFAEGRTLVVDGYSRAPAGVSSKSVSRAEQRQGYRSCTIPSTPATLGYAQERYGVLPREQVMAPAIRLAEEGYAITKLQRRQARWCLGDLGATAAAGRLFLNGGGAYGVGEVFRQRELGATLRRLAEAGVEDFYRGSIARALAEDMAGNGGLLTEQDLAECGAPVEREAASVGYGGHQVVSVPPPGGGWQVLLGLKILERLGCAGRCLDTERWYEVVAEATAAVFHERDALAVHPRDATPSLQKWILSDERAGEIAERLRGGGCGQGEAEAEEPGETTHLCTADGRGNVVALTQSIQSLFGAKVANGRLGFLYNNYLRTCKRRRHPYQLGSGCIPLSNIAPTLVLAGGGVREGVSGGEGRRGGEPLLAAGAAGSRRIVSAILQVVSGVLDRGLSLEEAVSLPRIHGLLTRKVRLERPAATESLVRRLEKRFRQVTIKAAHSYGMGGVQAIQFGSGGSMVGMADPRRDGTAAGV